MTGERSDPPRIGIWLMRHFYRGGDKDALTGDLIERFHEGQARGWFLRQVLVAIGVGVEGAVRRHWPHFWYAIAGTAMPFFFLSALDGPPGWLHWWTLPFPWSQFAFELSRPALLALAALPILATALIINQAFRVRFLIRTAAVNLALITFVHYLPVLCPSLWRRVSGDPCHQVFVFLWFHILTFFVFLASAWLACPLPQPSGGARHFHAVTDYN